MPYVPELPAAVRPSAVGQNGNLAIMQGFADNINALREAGLLVDGDLSGGGGGGTGGGVTAAEVQAAIDQTLRTPVALSKLHAQLALRTTKPTRIAFAGSSTTAGSLATVESKRYVNILADMMQKAYPSGRGAENPVVASNSATWTVSSAVGVQVYNAGQGGTMSSDYLTASERQSIATLAPAAVIHMIGSNDMREGRTVAQYKASLETVLLDLKNRCPAACVQVLVHAYARADAASATNAVDTWDNFGNALRELAAEDPDRVVFIDLSKRYEQLGITGLNSPDYLGLLAGDLIHQDNDGHAVMAEFMAQALNIPRPVYTTPFTAPTPPTAPTIGITAGDGEYTVTQTDAGSNYTTFELYTSTVNDGNLTDTPNYLRSDATSLPNTRVGATNGTTYYAQVRVTNANGDVAVSNIASGTPVAPNTPPVMPSDDFERTGELHGSKTTLGNKTWFVGLGDLVTPAADGVVLVGNGSVGAPGIATTHKAAIDLGVSDYIIETVLTARNADPALSGGGLFFRVGTDGSGYFLSIRVNSTTVGYALYKQTATAALMLQNTSVVPAPGDVLRAELSGSSVVLKVNGVALWPAYTMEINASATRAGFFLNATSDDSRYGSFARIS